MFSSICCPGYNLPCLGWTWKILLSNMCFSNAFSGVGSPGSAHLSISISESFGSLNYQLASTPPIFFRVKVIFLGLEPYLIGTLPKSQSKTFRFEMSSSMDWFDCSELLKIFSHSFRGFSKSWFIFIMSKRSHRLAMLICSLRTSSNLIRG